jgi:hypothetical protein
VSDCQSSTEGVLNCTVEYDRTDCTQKRTYGPLDIIKQKQKRQGRFKEEEDEERK